MTVEVNIDTVEMNIDERGTGLAGSVPWQRWLRGGRSLEGEVPARKRTRRPASTSMEATVSALVACTRGVPSAACAAGSRLLAVWAAEVVGRP